MDITISERTKGDVAVARAEHELMRVSAGMLRTLYDFAEQKPKTVFLVADLRTGEYSAFVGLGLQGRTLVRVENLSKLPGYSFNGDESRIASLSKFFSQDLSELAEAFRKARRMVPAKVTTAIEVGSANHRVQVSYELSGVESTSVSDDIDVWMNFVKQTGGVVSLP